MNPEKKNNRNYDSKKRNNIVDKISKIKSKSVLMSIYEIIKEEKNINLSKNNNGIFFDFNKLSDESIDKIVNLISDDKLTESSDSKINYTPYLSNLNDQTTNLSNKEKSILKKIKD